MVHCLVLVRHIQDLFLLLGASALALVPLQHFYVADGHLAVFVAAIAEDQCLLLILFTVKIRPDINRVGIVVTGLTGPILAPYEYWRPGPIVDFLCENNCTTELSAISGVKNSISLMGGRFRSNTTRR